jgi:excisionase family DNA binding protein
MTDKTQLVTEVLTVNEAARYLKVDRPHILTMLEDGRISGLKLTDGDWRISKERLLRLLDGNPSPAFIKEKPVSEPTKIGIMVRHTFDTLLTNNAIPADELHRLQDLSYCKHTFGVNFSVLRHVVPWRSLAEQRRTGRHPRYWKQVFSGGYLVTSEWYEWHRDAFIAWAQRIKGVGNGRA